MTVKYAVNIWRERMNVEPYMKYISHYAVFSLKNQEIGYIFLTNINY